MGLCDPCTCWRLGSGCRHQEPAGHLSDAAVAVKHRKLRHFRPLSRSPTPQPGILTYPNAPGYPPDLAPDPAFMDLPDYAPGPGDDAH